MKTKRMTTVKINIDGSCPSQGTENAQAGYGVAIRGGVHEDLLGRVDGLIQDSTRAEVTSFLKAIEWLKQYPGVEATIYTDSRMVVEVVHGLLEREDSNSEERRFWKLTKDLWHEIRKIMPEVESRIRNVVWVDRDQNEAANKLARRAANALILVSRHDLPQFCKSI